MLTLTENADTIATTIVAQQGEDPNAGLRIQTSAGDEPEQPRFAVTVAPSPQPGDDVVEGVGCRVFLEHDASSALTDKVLDADVDEQGAVSFTLLPQTA